MTELKPCPFCGSKNVKVRLVTDIHGIQKEWHDVMCQKCMANIPSRYRSEEEAIEAWNRRVE